MTKEEAEAAVAQQQAAEAQNRLASLLDGIGEGAVSENPNKRKHDEISGSGGASSLPHPWYAAKDSEGNTYYVNSETQATQWEIPSSKPTTAVAGYTEEQVVQYAQYYGMAVEAARDWLRNNQASA